MRKSRLKILPSRCLAQLGFLLLYLACPILGEMSRAQPDHGLASSLTLHVLEHCASPPEDPGDGSCPPMPEDTKVMTRNENGHATCTVASHILNLATKCAPEDHPQSEQNAEVTTVTLLPRRLLAARSKLPASEQESMRILPKRQIRRRSLKRDVDIVVQDSAETTDNMLVHSERDISRRSINTARRSSDGRRNMLTEVTRTQSRIGFDNIKGISLERKASRNLNRDSMRTLRSRDTHRTAQGESSRFRRVSSSRVNPTDVTNKLESFERSSADNRRLSSVSAERRFQETPAAERHSRRTEARQISSANLVERRVEAIRTNSESRRSYAEGIYLSELSDRKLSASRTSGLDFIKTRRSRKTSTERRYLDSRRTEVEEGKSSRFSMLGGRSVSRSSRSIVREKLSQIRQMEPEIQIDENRRSMTDKTRNERTSPEVRNRDSRTMSLAARHSLIARQKSSSERLSSRYSALERESRRLSRERLPVQRSSTERRVSESERVSVDQRRAFLRSSSEGKLSASRPFREDSRRHVSEGRYSSSPVRMGYDSSRRLLEIPVKQISVLGTSQKTILRRLSDERTAIKSHNGEFRSSRRMARDDSFISGMRRVQRSISLDRSDSSPQRLSRVQRSASSMNDRRLDLATTAGNQQNSMSHRRRDISIRNLPVEMRISRGRQERASVRMEERNRAVLRELYLTQAREHVRIARESTDALERTATQRRRARSAEERSSVQRLAMKRQEMRRTGDQDRAVERVLKSRRDSRASVFERSLNDRRLALRVSSRSEDRQSASRRVEERNRRLSDRSSRGIVNVRSSSVGRENRREMSDGTSVYRRTTEERSQARISRENDYTSVRFRSGDYVRLAGRRANTERTYLMRDSSTVQSGRSATRQNRRTTVETIAFADRRNTQRENTLETTRTISQVSRYSKTSTRKAEERLALVRISTVLSSRSAMAEDTRTTTTESTREISRRRMGPVSHITRAVHARRTLENANRATSYRSGSGSVEREARLNIWTVGGLSQRDNRSNRQLKALSAEHYIRRNTGTVARDAIRRQSASRQIVSMPRGFRTNSGNNYETRQYYRSAEVREDRRHMESGDRKITLRISRQSIDRLMPAAQYERKTAMMTTRSSKTRNYSIAREQREAWKNARSYHRTISSQELVRQPQRYERSSAFRKLTAHHDRLTVSKTGGSTFIPEINRENATAKTDMVRDATVEAYNKPNSSWLRDLAAAVSLKCHIGAFWQQILLGYAALSWTKTGSLDSISEKVTSYLLTSENMDILGAAKTAASNDRDSLLGTMIGGGAAAAALLLFSTRTK